jgi:hypothetical protein
MGEHTVDLVRHNAQFYMIAKFSVQNARIGAEKTKEKFKLKRRWGMLQLDFLSLYIVRFLNSLTICVIWAALVASHRDVVPSQIWQAGRGGYAMLTITIVGRDVSAFRVLAGGNDVG